MSDQMWGALLPVLLLLVPLAAGIVDFASIGRGRTTAR
jgi:hypothetical protein